MKPEVLRTEGFSNVTEAVGSVFRAVRQRIRVFKGQPRSHFDRDRLKELAASMKAEGQKIPIEVKEVEGDPDADYELIDGERRLRAAEIADLPEMLVWVKPMADTEEQFIESVVANFGREGHTPIETARAIRRIMAGPRFENLSRTERINRTAALFAKSPAWIYQHINFLGLHPKVQEMIEPTAPEGQRLNSAVANYLHNIADQELQLELAKRICAEKLTPNKARALIRKAIEKVGLPEGKRGRQPYDEYKLLRSFVGRLSESAELMLDMPMKKFRDIFRRNPGQRKEMVEKIDESIEALKQIRQELTSAAK